MAMATMGLRANAEELARDALHANNITPSIVQQVLGLIRMRSSSSRKKVMPEGADSVKGMVLGLFVRGNQVELTKASKDYPFVTKLLATFCQQSRPMFPFTSMQVNLDNETQPHTDGNNVLASQIWGCGNYRGGDLFVEDVRGNKQVTLKKDVAAGYPKGTSIRGFDVNVKNCFYEFPGQKLHFTRPFTGTRLTVVYYTVARFEEATPNTRIALADAGFAFSFTNVAMMVQQTARGTKRRRPVPSTAPEPSHAKLEGARKATWELLRVNSNQKGGGGTKAFREGMAKLRRKVRLALDDASCAAIEVILTAAEKHFEAKTPGSWRRFLPRVLEILGVPKADQQEAEGVANSQYHGLEPVKKAVRQARQKRRQLEQETNERL
ncbi:unnamed protein product [Durusdinium trenchii]|uniref:Uncharacterized protein n=1 Tax=Durusdinium trenchii TaxID=1381693 RepID=A0ABP0P7E6_9DINO